MRLAVQTPWVLMMRTGRPGGGLLKLQCRGREKGRQPVWRFGHLDWVGPRVINSISGGQGQPRQSSPGVQGERVGLLGALTEWLQIPPPPRTSCVIWGKLFTSCWALVSLSVKWNAYNAHFKGCSRDSMTYVEIEPGTQ